MFPLGEKGLRAYVERKSHRWNTFGGIEDIVKVNCNCNICGLKMPGHITLRITHISY